MARLMWQFTVVALLILAVPCMGVAAEKDTVTKQLKTVDSLNKRKDYESALTIIDKILKDNTTHSKALYQRAYILELQKKTPDAITAYEKCLEITLEEEPDRENKKLISKIKKALMKLDKSRKLVLKHAEELEKEAKKYKGKDDYAYEKIMDVVGYMKGVWDDQVDDDSGGNKKGKKRKINKRHRAFNKAIIDSDLDEAVRYIDPQLVNQVGKEVAKGFLQKLSGAIKMMKIKAGDLADSEITLGEGGKDAKVIPRYRKWGKLNDGDPQYWLLKGGKWYLADDKALNRFKPAKEK